MDSQKSPNHQLGIDGYHGPPDGTLREEHITTYEIFQARTRNTRTFYLKHWKGQQATVFFKNVNVL